MARLPTPGSDEGTWGDILNQYLLKSHNSDGTLKSGTVSTSTVVDASITEVKLDPAVRTKLNAVGGGSGPSSTDDLPEGTTNLYFTTARAQSAAPVQQVNGKTGNVSLTPADVGAATTAQGAKADSAVQPADLAAVATSGDYTDLTNQPTIPTVNDATTASKGIVQLAGDLGGSATAPTVPGLTTKADDSSVVHLAGSETIDGAKDFTGGLTVSGDGVVVDTDVRLVDQRVPLDDSVTDVKIPAGAGIAQSKIANLTTDLASKESAANKGVAGGYASLDGSGKVPSAQLPVMAGAAKIMPYSYAGVLAVSTGTFRLYNDSSSSWTIKSVRASVGTAPAGAAVIIDVKKNGTTIFTTTANRPAIAAAANTSGSVTNMDITAVA
ncbi:MAG TPA: hypothetical protein VFK03_02905, partial [Candidatus Saccharimonadales bacterium]|nr:hypothetical protein [Candidatus Saccharimonadales bacterium]